MFLGGKVYRLCYDTKEEFKLFFRIVTKPIVDLSYGDNLLSVLAQY